MAMLDFGESRCVLEVERAKYDGTFEAKTSDDWRIPDTFLGGVHGEAWFTLAWLIERREGGVRGMRPPAVRDEKRPAWLLIGVETEAEAIVCVM